MSWLDKLLGRPSEEERHRFREHNCKHGFHIGIPICEYCGKDYRKSAFNIAWG